jgi:hypothetical protein
MTMTGTWQSSLTLVRHDKHQRRRALDGLADVGDRNDVVGESHAGEILLVLVFGVDDLCELLAFELGWVGSASVVHHRPKHKLQMRVRWEASRG